jgi:GT2 family glycosyltransferase
VSCRLSLVVPTHNRPDLLRACLASIEHHAPPGTQVVVVDDASPRNAAGTVAAQFGRAQVLRLPRRSGFCVAANVGLRAARGGIVELLNDDTEVTAGWAEAALSAFDDLSVAAVAPLVLFADTREVSPPHVDSAGDRYYVGGVAGKRGHGAPLGPSYLQPCRVFGASASSAFYRRDVVLRLGAFPESFGAYFEDVDLSFRLHWAGFAVHFEPRSRVYHHGSASHGAPRRRLLEQQSRNEERVFWRNVPSLSRALPRHLAVLAAKAWRRWHEGSLTPFLCGRLRVLGEAAGLLRHRRWLRSLGGVGDVARWQLDAHFGD